MLYAPKPNEWIHKFTWHGEDGDHKTRIIPGAKTFEKLRLIPDQFYYNISDVRTSDDALITVKLMIFYELVDIEKMLNNTRDPIADFVSILIFNTTLFHFSNEFIVKNRSTLFVLMSLLLRPFENMKHFWRTPIN